MRLLYRFFTLRKMTFLSFNTDLGQNLRRDEILILEY